MTRKSLSSFSNQFSYKTLFSVLFILLIAFVILTRFIFPKQKVSAAWWNDSWNYRKAISISNNSGSDLTDFQISISVGTSALIASGKMQTDCDDIRITDINGNLLSHWIEPTGPNSCNQTTDTRIWVKASSLPTSGAIVYFYYGNSSTTSASSGTDTFIYFKNNFQTPDLGWNWSNGGTENNWAKTWANGADNPGSTMTWIKNIINITGQEVVVEFTVKATKSGSTGHGTTNVLFNPTQTTALYNNTSNSTITNGNGNSVITFGDYSGWYGKTGFDATTGQASNIANDTSYPIYQFNTDGWVRHVHKLTNSSLLLSGYSLGGLSVGSSAWTYNEKTVTSGYTKPNNIILAIGEQYYESIWLREAFVRKYTAIEPTVSLQSEETGGGPVAYWKFDEGSGTIAHDSSSNKNDGTLSGTTLPTWIDESQCVSGKCLNSTGNGYVDAGNPSKFSIQNNSITIETWVKFNYLDYTNNTGGLLSLIGKGNPDTAPGTASTGFWFTYDNRNNRSTFNYTCFGNSAGGWSGGNNNFGGYNYTFTSNTWYHLAVTISQNEGRLFINGKQIGSAKTFSGLQLNDTLNNLFIGKASSGSNIGSQDEVKIYSYARTADQIKQDYNSRGSSKSSSTNLGSAKTDNNLSNGLVGYWKFDESSGTASDSSGNNNNAVISGTNNYGPGKFGNAFRSGVGTTNLVTNPSFETNIASWSYQNIVAGTATNTNTKSLFGNYSLMITRSVGSSEANVYNTLSGLTANTVYYYSAWAWANTSSTACIFTYNSTTNLSPVCHSGSGKWERIGGTFTSSATGTVQLRLSHSNYSNLNNVYFDGVQVELGSTQTHYVDGSMGTGTSWLGTANASVSVRTSSSGFVNNSTSLDISTNQISYGTWIYLQEYDKTYNVVFQKNGFNDGYRMVIDSIGRAVLEIGCSLGGVTNTIGIIPLNTWTHVFLTYDGQKINSYINGQLNSTTNYNRNLVATSTGISFGPTEYPNISGFFDELRIYNRALTPAEISQLYNFDPNQINTIKKPIAYYKLDENNGSNIFDSSGNNNHGIFGVGDSSPSWTDGKIKKSVFFGGGDYIDISNTNFQNKFTQANDFTISSWIKINTLGSNNPIVGQQSNSYMNFFINSSSRLCLSLDDGSVCSNQSVETNSWQHVVVTYKGTDSSQQVYLYLNGNLIGSGIEPDDASPSTSQLYIGYENRFFNSFNGSIDEIKIYNSALNQNEILQDYNQGSAIVFGTTTQTIGNTTTSLEYCIPGDTSHCTSPIIEYNFEENNGTTTKNSIENNYNGTLIGSPVWTTGKNSSGSSLKFNGTTDYLDIGTIPSLSVFSVEAWIKAGTDITDYRTIIDKSNGFSDRNFWLALESGTGQLALRFSIAGTSTTYLATTALNDNKWHHVTATYDNSYVKLYVDGKLNMTPIAQTGIPNTGTATSHIADQANTRKFIGSIDQVRIYNYARTPAQIIYDYNKGNPVGWWKMDECQGAIIHDSSGNNNHGTLSIGQSGTQNSIGTCQNGTSAAWTNGASGHTNASLYLDGTDDYIESANNFGSYKELTISAWIKTTSTKSEGNTLISNIYDFGSGWQGILLNIGRNTAGKVAYYAGGGWIESTSPNYNSGQWINIIVTHDSTGTVKFYKNAILDGTATGKTLTNSTTPLFIGYERSGTPRYFQGQIDDVRLYNYALTEEQVKVLYNGGAVSF